MRKYISGEVITNINGKPYYFMGADTEFKNCFIVLAGKEINKNNFFRVSRNYDLIPECIKNFIKEELDVYEVPEELKHIAEGYNESCQKEIEIDIYNKVVSVEYTGGGIWIAEKYLDKDVYATIDNDFIDCLTIYKKTENETIFESKNISDLNEKEKKIYKELLTALKEKIDEEV